MPTRTAHVVGRGIIGLSLAYELGKRGWRVFVVGPRDKPGTASRAAVGATSLKGQIQADQPLFAVKMYGHEGMPAWLAELQAASGCKIAHGFSGVFEPFSSVTEYAGIRNRVFHKRFTGCLNVELVGAKQFEAKGLPKDHVLADWQGAYRYYRDGWITPDDLLKALEAAHLKAHGEFIETEVQAVKPGKNSGMILETLEGQVEAETVVIAAGIFSNEILRASGFEGLEQQAVEGETLFGEDDRKADFCLRVGKLNYVHDGHQVRIGSTSGPRGAVGADLEAKASKAFGWTQNSTRRWGIRGRFRDRIPAIGQLFFPGRGIGPWVSLGYYKNGIQLHRFFAQNLVSMIEGQPPAPTFRPFLLDRFPAFSTPSSAF